MTVIGQDLQMYIIINLYKKEFYYEKASMDGGKILFL